MKTGERADGRAAHRAAVARLRGRPPRPRVEVTVNEFNGTVSWRVLSPARLNPPGRGRAGDSRARPRTSEAPTTRARAAALRAAGLDPNAPAKGAAPIPTHPASVRAAVAASATASLSPEQLQAHLARVGMLRSQLAGDFSRAARMPSAVAARLRTVPSSAQLHAVTTAQSALSSRPAAPRPGASPAAGPHR
ncbi:hypothetical protein ACGFYV_07520 [Streptomyces sp. NPDC048297]|uniref:hypothetical protein n=1 Tax=Streptomyces sp. NPDC048297 TaxID=3365531 RepID=UPI003714A9E0